MASSGSCQPGSDCMDYLKGFVRWFESVGSFVATYVASRLLGALCASLGLLRIWSCDILPLLSKGTQNLTHPPSPHWRLGVSGTRQSVQRIFRVQACRVCLCLCAVSPPSANPGIISNSGKCLSLFEGCLSQSLFFPLSFFFAAQSFLHLSRRQIGFHWFPPPWCWPGQISADPAEKMSVGVA